MAAPKTIVITLPKQLNGRTSQVVLPATTTAMASKQLSDLLSGNFVQLIKEEIPDKMLDDDTGKPPRKRQRLDHLTMEEKIMRRKLKNRVAAQTARDRKKMRMDQLEAQLSELSEHVAEVDQLNAILTEQNAELAEKREVLEMMLSKCICGLNNGGEIEEGDNCISETHKSNVFEGVMIPVSAQVVGSAAGSQCTGSNKDHVSHCTLLPMGKRNSYDSLEAGSDQFVSQPSVTHSITEVSEKTVGQQMVGTSSTVVESSWDVADHDYTKGCRTPFNMNLTTAEDDLIMQLTNALSQGNNPSSTEQLSQDEGKEAMAVHVPDQNEELPTPDVLEGVLDFDSVTNLLTNTNSGFEANENLLCIGQQSTFRAPPHSKAQILDFLQDKITTGISSPVSSGNTGIPSPVSSGGSESGYESLSSPKSVDSLENHGSFEYTDELMESPMSFVSSAEVEEDSGLSLDIESFNELFPSLF